MNSPAEVRTRVRRPNWTGQAVKPHRIDEVDAADPAVEQAVAPRRERPIRAAEVVGALSLATDLGTGQPLEHALRTAVLAVRLGELAGASAQELADTYYVALLHASGCTSNGPAATQLHGHEIEHRQT